MSHHNKYVYFAISMGLMAFINLAAANEGSTNAPIPRFEASVHKGEIIGSEQIQRVFLNSGLNQFLLVAPTGLIVDATKPDKVSFHPSDQSFFLIVRMIGNGGVTIGTPNYFSLLQQQYPEARVLAESSARMDGQSAPVFDLVWKPSDTSERSVRVAYVITPAGLIEFSAVSEAQSAAAAQEAINGLMRGFRSNRNGKIEITAYPNCS